MLKDKKAILQLPTNHTEYFILLNCTYFGELPRHCVKNGATIFSIATLKMMTLNILGFIATLYISHCDISLSTYQYSIFQ
jgi:hypothetical protein